MTKTYVNKLLNAFDQEYESLVIPFPTENTYYQEEVPAESFYFDERESVITPNDIKLRQIENLAAEISAQRYEYNYNPELCLANLLNFILSHETEKEAKNDFFQLLNQERNVSLNEALNDFDFYLNNPFRKKAEKILLKIEARKNK